MNTPVNTAKKRSLIKRIFIYLGYLILALALLALVAKYVWRYSGDGHWKLEIDRDGVQVYSKKDSGSSLLKYKTIRRVNYPLQQLVASIKDTTLQNCKDWFPECISMETLKEWDPATLSHTHVWTMGFGEPLTPRDLVVEQKFTQDPVTKSALVEITAKPDLIPERDCCVRIPRMNNTWRYTPLENGEVEVEFVQDSDFGGMIPDFMMNMDGAEMNHYFISEAWLELVDQEKYRNASFDFIVE
ncbi:START domain-containing protein [Marinicella sediminis]|uniref:START domain-containing protein n=1 Tax=Marinicella sediminis TaxID=1792834 RepID=A0ABV7JFS0_9GAMM|nr:START domain-containing protein [Marinicella sediminis]